MARRVELPSKAIVLRLPVGEYKTIKLKAKMNGTTMTALLRAAIRRMK